MRAVELLRAYVRTWKAKRISAEVRGAAARRPDPPAPARRPVPAHMIRAALAAQCGTGCFCTVGECPFSDDVCAAAQAARRTARMIDAFEQWWAFDAAVYGQGTREQADEYAKLMGVKIVRAIPSEFVDSLGLRVGGGHLDLGATLADLEALLSHTRR